MQRRNLLIGMGSLAAGGAATIGTGAFTSVSANRSIAVNVADDSDALLGLKGDKRGGSYTPNAVEYVDTNGGQVSIDITETDAGATGINDNATTILDDLLAIENQGSQDVYVGYTHPASPNGNFALYHEDSDFLDPSATNPGTDDYDAGAGKYTNDGQLNINTAPDADTDGNPDLVKLSPGETLEHIGMFFFGSPDVSSISADPITFQAVDEFSDL
jgi:hypothetical protein